jgi:hypothetical protein
MKYIIYDISKWQKLENFTITGRTVKNLYLSPESKLYLFKISERNPGCLLNTRGSHWAEKFCTEIGKILNIEIQKTELARNSEEIGVICEIFLDIKNNEEMLHGKNIIDFDDKYDDYTLERILNELQKFYNDNKLENFQKIQTSFANMMFFDWFIGNTDRHDENWGIIKKQENNKTITRFAPLYDNATSFTNELPIENVKNKLNDPRQFKAYINRAKSLIKLEKAKKPKYNEVILKIKQLFPCEYKRFEKILLDNENVIIHEINNIPDKLMIYDQKELIKKIILSKIKFLKNDSES